MCVIISYKARQYHLAVMCIEVYTYVCLYVDGKLSVQLYIRMYVAFIDMCTLYRETMSATC